MPRKKNATRKDGRIAVQVYLGRDENNKRIYKTVYGSTQKEADEKALQVKLALRKGLDVMAERDTFASWADRWLKLKKAAVSLGHYASCRSAANYLCQFVGDFQLVKVKAADLQAVITDLAQMNPHTGKPTAYRTLLSVKNSASQIFRLAIDNRVVQFNPADAVRMPRSDREAKRRALTMEEQSWIEETPHLAQTAAMIMMHAGLRRGELIPLTWADIDLEKRTITVNKTVERLSTGKFIIKHSAKTQSSIRVIDIPIKLKNHLVALPRNSFYVCTNAHGDMHSEASWKSMWESYLRDLNMKYGTLDTRFKSKYNSMGVPMTIPRFTPHWLRHTYATNLFLAGVDVMVAKEQLGHTSIKTTLGVYTHISASHKRRSMDKLDAFYEAMQVKCKSTSLETH